MRRKTKKRILVSLLGLVVIALVFIKLIALSTHTRRPSGLIDGELKPCSTSPNCFSTEGRDGLLFESPEEDWQRAQIVLSLMGGTPISINDYYAHYEFTSFWMGYIDDVQIRQDTSAHALHFRSASRVGYYDFDVNFDRYQKFREMF